MKRKVVREVDVIVKIVESKKCFKMRVEDDVRLKTIANNLCKLMNIDPYCTEWAFYTANDNHYEVPIAFTLKQVDFTGGSRVLLAKIMSTTAKLDYFVETTIESRLDSRWRRRIEKGTNFKKDVSIQTEEIASFGNNGYGEPSWYDSGRIGSGSINQILKMSSSVDKPKKPRVIYTMYGIEDPMKLPPRPKIIHEKPTYDIWDNLNAIEQSRIMRGMNVVGYCTNEKCINFERWILISLGFGR
jgi:hypothetical protein